MLLSMATYSLPVSLLAVRCFLSVVKHQGFLEARSHHYLDLLMPHPKDLINVTILPYCYLAKDLLH
uniref:Uncharacterized protein n=1 Tax=Arundo donax TaxID=35708 RepID=A0A0A8YM32_ARUDO